MGKLCTEIYKEKLDRIFEDLLVTARTVEGMEDKTEFTYEEKEMILSYFHGKMMEEYEKTGYGKAWDFSKERALSVFAEAGDLTIAPIKDSDRDFYLSIRKQYWDISGEEEVFEWESTQQKERFCCLILLSGEPCGYIDLKDTSKNLWEIGIELDKDHCHKGIGGKAVMLFLEKISMITGKTQFQVLIEPDNPASLKCFEKIGAKFIDTYLVAFSDDDETADYEEKHLDMITPEMRELAARLGIEPRELLSHVLDYRIILEKPC